MLTNGGTLMKCVTLCLVFVVAAFGAVGLATQGKPNLSGTWISIGPQQQTLSVAGHQDHDQTRWLRKQDECA
jgi:hypothetical protein